MSQPSRTKALSEFAEINPRFRESLTDDTPVSFIPMAAVSAESGTTSAGEQRRYIEVSKGFTPFLHGDVLVAKITPCFENGKIAQAKLQHRVGFGSTEFHVVRAIENKSDARYLLHFLRQDRVKRDGERRMTGSAGQRRVPENFLAGLKILALPVIKQRRIAEILDCADALRTKRRAALAELDDLTQAIFLDLFGDPKNNPNGWATRSFDNTMCDETSRSQKLAQSEYKTEGRFPIIDQGQRDIAGYCDESAVLCVSPLPVVVFGDHTRITKLVKTPFIIGADGAKVLVPQSDIEPTFLLWLLRLSSIPDLGYSRHMREVKRLRFIAPPMALQRAFGQRVATIEKLKATHRASLAELDALFASLQHRAFRGEL